MSCRWISVTRAVLAVCGTALPIAAKAATIPAGAEVRVGRSIDIAAFRLIVARRYHVQLYRVVAADIDRDGDVDLLAATDLGFVLWVNDGAGRLTSQAPQYTPIVDGRRTGNTWRQREPRSDETIQNDLPSPRLPTEYAHAPPSRRTHSAQARETPLNAAAVRGWRVPRAPPPTTL